MTVYCVIIFIAGLIVGSFLSMCIYRIPMGESLTISRPHCMDCGRSLKLTELIPVASFIVQKGKCRNCGVRLPFRYPLVELMTAVIYLLLFLRYGLSVDFTASAFIMSVLIAVFFIDIDHRIIPNGLVITGLSGAIPVFAYNIFHPLNIYGDSIWWNPLSGIPAGAGFLFLTAVVGLILYKSDNAMGMGDVKIFIPIGLFLGWRITIVALLAAIFLSGIASLIMLLAGLKKVKSTIAFGPFIVAGTFIGYMWGWDIINWYLSS